MPRLVIARCPPKPPISDRPLLTVEQANELGEVFWILILYSVCRDTFTQVVFATKPDFYCVFRPS